MSGFNDIPIRQNGKDFKISAEWFNTIRTKLVTAFGSGGYIAPEPQQVLDDNDEFTFSTTSFKPLLQVIGNSAEVIVSPTPFGTSHGFGDGKEIIIIGLSDTDLVTIPETDIDYGIVNADGGDIVLKRFSYVLLIWNETLKRFIAATSGGQGGVGFNESLGTGNGIAVNFNLTNLPLTDESFILFRNGLLVPSSEYSFSNPTITFNNPPAQGQRIDAWVLSNGQQATTPASGQYIVQYIDLIAGDITNKQVQLSNVPSSAAKVIVDIIGGVSQKYGTDFTVSGDILDWDGLGLEGELLAGDCLRVTYFA